MAAMTGVQKAVVGLAVLVVLAAGGYLAYGLLDNGTTPRTYPASVRDNFLVSCAEAGGHDEGCRCALTALQDQFELVEFTALERSFVRSGDYPDPFVHAITARCGAPATSSTMAGPSSTTTTAPSTHTSGDPVARTVVADPGRGLWVTTSGGPCYYELLRGGVIVENAVASTLSVGSGVTSLRWDPSCSWEYDGFESGD